MTRATGLRLAGQKLSVALDSWSLASALEQSLPDLGIDTALVSLTEAPDSGTFLPVFALRDGKVLALEPERYPRAQLFPSELLDATKPWGLIALALTFETSALGLIVFDVEADAFACEALRSQVAASLMMRSLHERIVHETAARERLAREHLQSEMAIARRIQTALAPKDPGKNRERRARMVALSARRHDLRSDSLPAVSAVNTSELGGRARVAGSGLPAACA